MKMEEDSQINSGALNRSMDDVDLGESQGDHPKLETPD